MQKDFFGGIFICTAVKFKNEQAFFGRNLDVEFSYGEKIVFAPRNFRFAFNKNKTSTGFAMIGLGTVFDGVPFFYDAVNEHGLYIAALNFPESAAYFPEKEGMENVASFELIPFVLSRCSSTAKAEELLKNVNITDRNFSEELEKTPLHWFLADKDSAAVIEPLSTGLSVTKNEIGVLANEPSFDFHIKNLSQFINVSPRETENRFSENLMIKPFSRGIGAFGLPGDFSSASRFVKAAFVKENSLCGESEEESVTQFFHILSSVSMPKGSVRLSKGELEHTLVSTCASEGGKYFFRSYQNSRISFLDIKKEHLDSSVLKIYPISFRQDFLVLNQ